MAEEKDTNKQCAVTVESNDDVFRVGDRVRCRAYVPYYEDWKDRGFATSGTIVAIGVYVRFDDSDTDEGTLMLLSDMEKPPSSKLAQEARKTDG